MIPYVYHEKCANEDNSTNCFVDVFLECTSGPFVGARHLYCRILQPERCDLSHQRTDTYGGQRRHNCYSSRHLYLELEPSRTGRRRPYAYRNRDPKLWFRNDGSL